MNTNQTSFQITPELYNAPFMRACRRESVPYTPVWLMRQAGRYMSEYRAVRDKVSFLELCKNPDLATEVTVYAAHRLGVDAAIIFADILLITEPLGLDLEFAKGDGPKIHNPVRTYKDVERVRQLDDVSSLSYVYQAIKQTRRALKNDLPLIGFAGAPFTVAAYIIEGGSSRNFIHTKRLMYTDAAAWHTLLRRIAHATVLYLNEQIKAGAQAVQLFDSWVGCLSADDYQTFVQPHTKYVTENINRETPVLHFGTDTATLLEAMRDAGGDCLGLDWRINLDEGWRRIGYDKAVQGNLDPVTLFADSTFVVEQARKILQLAANRNGHIFNLGHGILPETPVDNVLRLVEAVHELSAR